MNINYKKNIFIAKKHHQRQVTESLKHFTVHISRFTFYFFILTIFSCAARQPHEKSSKYREVLGPAGNPYVEVEAGGKTKLTEGDIPENIRKLVEIIAPGPKVFEIENGHNLCW